MADNEEKVLQVAERMIAAASELGASQEVFVIASIDAAVRIIKFGAGLDTVAALDELMRVLQSMRAAEARVGHA